jgi:fatty acid synthase subunit alpha
MGEELPLEELGSALGVGYSGALGKYVLGLVLRMAGGKCLADSTSHRSKLVFLRHGDSVLHDRTACCSLVPRWSPLNDWALRWRPRCGSIQWSLRMLSGPVLQLEGLVVVAQAGHGATINSEEFLKFQAEQEFAAQHVELYMRYLKRDSRSGDIAFDKEQRSSKLR